MKIYHLNRINVLKFLTFSLIGFMLNFSVCIILVRLIYEMSGINLASIFLFLLAILHAFFMHPWYLKKSSENVIIQISKDEITICGESYLLNDVQRLELNYSFLVFPKLKIKSIGNRHKSFFIKKYRKDYFEFADYVKQFKKYNKANC